MGSQSSNQDGLYCSTSGTYFTDKTALQEHYKSDFHQYNLKRKVAGLPPVKKEWFEARKSQLQSLGQQPTARIWVCPVTGKKFSSEKTYNDHTKSKKFLAAAKNFEGELKPKVIVKQATGQSSVQSTQALKQAQPGHQITPAVQIPQEIKPIPEDDEATSSDAVSSAGSSNWSMHDDDDPWDTRVSFFDNHISESMESNINYMEHKFGFTIPDKEYVSDMEGLLQYLGAKLSVAHIPFHASGADPQAKRFRSLRAVQAHMLDTNQCNILFDDNEEEYEDYYDYAEYPEPSDTVIAMYEAANDLCGTGAELVVPSQNGGVSVLGSRDFARYYRQRPRFRDERLGVLMNRRENQNRMMITSGAQQKDVVTQQKAQTQAEAQYQKYVQQVGGKANVTRNLPRNVPY